jgi:hypothetical protein
MSMVSIQIILRNSTEWIWFNYSAFCAYRYSIIEANKLNWEKYFRTNFLARFYTNFFYVRICILWLNRSHVCHKTLPFFIHAKLSCHLPFFMISQNYFFHSQNISEGKIEKFSAQLFVYQWNKFWTTNESLGDDCAAFYNSQVVQQKSLCRLMNVYFFYFILYCECKKSTNMETISADEK